MLEQEEILHQTHHRSRDLYILPILCSQEKTLWGIAAAPHIYQDPFQWPLIYCEPANNDQISDPDLIFPYQTLVFSPDPAQIARNSAIAYAKTRGAWSLYDGEEYEACFQQ